MSANRLVLTALRGTTRTTRATRTSWAILSSYARRALRFVAHSVGVALFAVIVAFIITRTLVVSSAEGVLGLSQRNRLSKKTTASQGQAGSLAQLTVSTLIALCTLALWCVSLRWVNVGAMNDLGLVSALPFSCLIALAGVTLGFCLTLNSLESIHPFVLLFYLLALIFMLYATPALVEQAPRFAVTYWLAGHTDYVLQNGAVSPYFDAYFNWPGFFVLTGLLTKITGVSSVLVFAPWASFVYNLLYLAPMYLIFSTLTHDRRTVWLGLWFFYITDWVWQDYFDPQGLNLFFYLVIIAILLKGFQTAQGASGAHERFGAMWRRVRARRGDSQPVSAERQGARIRVVWARFTAVRPTEIWVRNGGFSGYADRLRRWAALTDVAETPQERRRRIALLGVVVAIFALSVFSHPITPFFILLSVTALTLFGKITPRWLPLLFGAMILGWDLTAAMPYLAGHLRSDLASFGNFQVVASTNVTNRLVAGSADHQFVSHVRIVTTAAIWGLAVVGFLLRWRRNALSTRGAKRAAFGLNPQDMTLLLLVAAPGLLVIAQPYGGEMAMRYYLFTLPIVSFFAASTFRTRVTFRIRGVDRLSRWFTSRSISVASVAIVVACIVLLGGFMFARYGNESADYVTANEANAVAYLYSVAPKHSLLLAGWAGTPWRYQDLEGYNYSQLYMGKGQAAALEGHDTASILGRASDGKYLAVYVILSRSQMAQAEMFAGVPAVAFTNMENALLATGRFKLLYSNADADILVYVPPPVSLHPSQTRGLQRGLTV